MENSIVTNASKKQLRHKVRVKVLNLQKKSAETTVLLVREACLTAHSFTTRYVVPPPYWDE